MVSILSEKYKLSLKPICLQPVVVMPLVRAVCSVLIQVDNVPAMLDIKGQSVMLLVVVHHLVLLEQHVMLLLVNVLAKMVFLVPPVTLLQVRFWLVEKILMMTIKP